MTTHLLANISHREQRMAIRYAKCESPYKQMEVEDLADAEGAIFEISETWGKTQDWVKRYLAATFMIALSFVNLFDDAQTERVYRVRVKTKVERVA